MCFRLVPKSMTLDDLEQLLHTLLHKTCVFLSLQLGDLGDSVCSGVTVRASDLRQAVAGSTPGRDAIYSYQCTNSAFHPSRVGKSSTGLVGWGNGGACSLVRGGTV